MKKQDITEYSENELSLIVMNDEGLYKMRRSLLRDPSFLDEFLIYTKKQLKVLIKDIQDDLEE